MHAFAPQIEEARGKAHVLGVFRLGIDRKRQRFSLRPNLELGDHQLYLAGIELGVDHIRGARGDLPGHRDDAFQPQRIGGREQRRGHVDDALSDAVVISQIDKKELAMVAFSMHPSR